jgi:phospholipid/cholesterol/gamma-HCH transport system ATP-binding protein
MPAINHSEDAPGVGPAVIRVRGLVKRFGAATVLNGIDLDVYKGETVVIMGGSGCGKTTLLRHMIASLKPSQGTIEVLGSTISAMPEAEIDQVRKKFGILFQSGALFNSMTLRQNVALPLTEHTDLPAATIEIMVKIKLELVGLREHAEKYPAEISGGMKKRAGLARALALDPQILFYDEPTAGLDPVTSAAIDRLIIDLSKQLGVTSVVVTHEMDSAFAIADRMVMLDCGKVLLVESRQYFDDLRKSEAELDQSEALIRQFLRGSAVGPLTQRKDSSDYAEDLLGFAPPTQSERPAVQTTRPSA